MTRSVRPLVIITLASFIFAHLSNNTSILIIMIPLVMLGAGMGLSMMPLKTYVLQSAPQNLVGRVTSLMAAMEQVITVFTIAGFSTIVAIRVESNTELGAIRDVSVLAASFGDTLLVVSGIAVLGVS